MPRAASRLSLIWSLALCLQPLGLAQEASPADETALRAVAEKLFAAYAREDLEGFMGRGARTLLSLVSRRKAMQEALRRQREDRGEKSDGQQGKGGRR